MEFVMSEHELPRSIQDAWQICCAQMIDEGCAFAPEFIAWLRMIFFNGAGYALAVSGYLVLNGPEDKAEAINMAVMAAEVLLALKAEYAAFQQGMIDESIARTVKL
jgi:hypothetical protein